MGIPRVADRKIDSKASAIRISFRAGFSTADAAALAGTSPRYARAVKARMNQDRGARNIREDVGWVRERVRSLEIAIERIHVELRALRGEMRVGVLKTPSSRIYFGVWAKYFQVSKLHGANNRVSYVAHTTISG